MEVAPVKEESTKEDSDYFAPPRYKSNCDLMNCSGQHISVKDPSSGLDLYFCVPRDLGYSVDEYRTNVEKYLAEKAK